MFPRFVTTRAGVVCVVAALSLALTGFDQLADSDPARLGDVIVDFLDRATMLAAMAIIALLITRVTALRREADAARSELDGVAATAQVWRRQSRRLFEGLNEAVAAQFRAWALSPAEADVAGLLLKGLPLADIADLRRTSEATIRQQAQAIYRKSGLSNRSEFAAYFLEDLFDVAGAMTQKDPAQGGPMLN